MKKRKSIKMIIIILICIITITTLFFSAAFFTLRIKRIDNKDLEIAYDSKNFTKPNIKCSDLGQNIPNHIKTNKKVNTKKLGKQEITYTCKSLIFTKSIKVKYRVKDKEKPIIKLNGKDKLVLFVNDKYVEPGFTATDNYDGDITKKVKVDNKVNNKKEGTYTITYTVSDSSNNSNSIVRTITYKKQEQKAIIAKKYVKTGMSCGSPGVIYLTFDDGPNGTYTPKILNVLKKYDVKATFFVTSAGPDSMLKREINEGHAIGLHSSSHRYDKIYTSSEAFWADMKKVSDRVKRVTGKEVNILRFPGGGSNTISRRYKEGIMSLLAKEIEDKGYAYFDWNISSGDAGGLSGSFDTKVSKEIKNVTNNLSKSRGNVILMHDIQSTTAAAIESIVKYGKDNGYKFDILTKDTGICHQRVAN